MLGALTRLLHPWCGLTHDLTLFELPTEPKHWMLVAKEPGNGFRRCDDAAMKRTIRRFVAEKEKVEHLRSLEAQIAQQLLKPPVNVGPRGEGGEILR